MDAKEKRQKAAVQTTDLVWDLQFYCLNQRGRELTKTIGRQKSLRQTDNRGRRIEERGLTSPFHFLKGCKFLEGALEFMQV